MNENMKDEKPIEAAAKKPGKPWKTVKGPCREVPIYRWFSGGRKFFRVPNPDGTNYTTSNQQSAISQAMTMSGVPLKLVPTLAGVTPELLIQTAEAVQQLEPVLKPLDMSIHAGLEEYAQLKARTGKLVLTGLFDSLLSIAGSAVNAVVLEQRLGEISAAIAKLAPILGPLNISIASGIEEYAAVKAKAGTQDLRELFLQLLSKTWVEKSKTPFGTVVNAFLLARKEESKVSKEYHKTLYYTLGAAVEKLGAGVPIGEVTTDQLKPIVFVATRTPRSNKTVRTNFCTLFKWCQLNQYLDFTQPTAADRLAKIKVLTSAPRILTVAEATAFFSALEDPWCLLYLAVSLFTGIRHDELQRLTFDLIKPGKVVDITEEISKTGKRRLIPIQPVLEAWLAPFYGRTGLVIPIVNIQLKVREFLQASSAAGLPSRWWRNWFRQSYCSYRLAQTGKVLQTAEEDGHYAYVLERTYLHLSSQQEGDAFFALNPAACGKPDWNEKVKAFLKDQPEVKERRKAPRPWKKIGGEPAAIVPPTAASAIVVLPPAAQTPNEEAA